MHSGRRRERHPVPVDSHRHTHMYARRQAEEIGDFDDMMYALVAVVCSRPSRSSLPFHILTMFRSLFDGSFPQPISSHENLATLFLLLLSRRHCILLHRHTLAVAIKAKSFSHSSHVFQETYFVMTSDMEASSLGFKLCPCRRRRRRCRRPFGR